MGERGVSDGWIVGDGFGGDGVCAYSGEFIVFIFSKDVAYEAVIVCVILALSIFYVLDLAR
jgi:hypothetical protein